MLLSIVSLFNETPKSNETKAFVVFVGNDNNNNNNNDDDDDDDDALVTTVQNPPGSCHLSQSSGGRQRKR